MRPGDVIAFGGVGLATALVRIFTGSVLSHVGMVSEGPIRKVRMLEAVCRCEPIGAPGRTARDLPRPHLVVTAPR